MITHSSSTASSSLFTRTFVLTWLATYFHFASFYVLFPTLPLYLAAVNATEAEIGLVIGAFSGTALFLRPFVGREANRRSRKWIMFAGAAIFVVAGLSYNFALSVPTLIAVRLLHGCGMAMFATGSNTLIADLAPANRRGEVTGVYGMSTNMAMATAPAFGAFVADVFGFSAVFFLVAGLAAAEAVLSLLIDEPPRPMQVKQTPLVSRGAIFPASVFMVFLLTYGALTTFVPLYAEANQIENPGLTFFSVYAVALIVARAVTGRLADRYGRIPVVIPGLILGAIAVFLIATTATQARLIFAAVIYGVSFAAVQPTLMALTIDRVPASERGSAMATYTIGYDVGISIGSVIFASILELTNFPTMFRIAAITPILALGLTIPLTRRQS